MIDLDLLVEDVEVVDKNEAAREEWLQKRAGRITCSRFGDLIGEGRSKDSLFTQTGYAYLQLLVAERLGSWYSFSSSATQWGTNNEATAIDEYRRLTGYEVDSTPFNFFCLNAWIGGTPDGLVGSDGTIEVKCPFNPSVHIGTLLSMSVPKEYEWQVYGHMLVTDRKWCDFISFDPRIQGKQKIAIVRVDRDEAKIAFLKSRLDLAVKVMSDMMEQVLDADLIEFIRTYRGPYQIYEAAGDLAALGASGGNWPNATAQHWKRELDRLVADGKLQEVDGGLIVPLSDDANQLELF